MRYKKIRAHWGPLCVYRNNENVSSRRKLCNYVSFYGSHYGNVTINMFSYQRSLAELLPPSLHVSPITNSLYISEKLSFPTPDSMHTLSTQHIIIKAIGWREDIRGSAQKGSVEYDADCAFVI